MTTKTMTWEEERAERQRIELERHRELLAMAQVAAAYLGGDWTARDEKIDPEYPNQVPDRVYLVNKSDERKIVLTTPAWNFKGKIEVYGSYDFGPKEYGLELSSKHRPAPSINVGFERGGVALAKAILSRFMPTFDEIVFELAQRIQEIHDYRKEQAGICGRLAKVLGCSYSPESSARKNGYNRFSHNDAQAWKRAEVYVSNGSVDLKLENLPEALAAQVLEIVAPHLKGERA